MCEIYIKTPPERKPLDPAQLEYLKRQLEKYDSYRESTKEVFKPFTDHQRIQWLEQRVKKLEEKLA